MAGAAETGHLAVCQFLVAEQCQCDAEAFEQAAALGHTEIVRFLHESGHSWDHTTICMRAAQSGSIELLQFLKPQGCVFTAEIISTAAALGHLQTCQFLRAEQCPWDDSTCRCAAQNGHVDVLRWLHEQGCPWNVEAVRMVAASTGQVCVIMYMAGVEPAASAAQLTGLMQCAAANHSLPVAKWLRQQGAEWPAVLKFGSLPWSADALQWARDEGCTSPTR
jgi:Ankyrin repeats (3 copies)